MHIGLIGGIGPAATEFYYRGLTDRHAKSGTRLELTIANAEVRDLVRNLANKDARKQAEIFAALILRLKAAGAQLAAVTSMGGHFCIGELLPISPLPILNGIPEVDAAVKRGRFKSIGIIGTRMVMETRLYGAISSATVVAPRGAELEEVHANYAGMAAAGRVDDAQRRVFFTVVSACAAIGAPRSCCSAAPTCSSHSRGPMPASQCSIARMCTSRRSTRRRCVQRRQTHNFPPAMGVEVSPVNCCDAAAIERAIAAFADSSNGGLIVTGSQFGANHPDVFVALAARYKLPTIYRSGTSLAPAG